MMLKPGSEEVRKLFLKDGAGVRLNHGSYGLVPEPVMNVRFKLLREQEEQPDVWFRINLEKYYQEAVACAADFVGANAEDLFVIDNATTGTNCILKSLKFELDSEILLTSHTYLGVKNTAQEVEEFYGLKRRFIQLTFPICSDDDILQLYENHLLENKKIKIAVLDHITSASAILMPVQKLVNLCRKYNVISVIDGAHCPGQVELNMKNLGADFYVGNFHKWVYSSRSCAFLWVSPSYRGQIRHVITSNYQQTQHHRFGFIGTRDYSPFFTLPTALKFYEEIGGLKGLTSYAGELLSWAQPMLCDALGTKPLDIPSSMRAPCMSLLELPPWPSDVEKVSGDVAILLFWKKYSVQTAVMEFDGKMFLRLSANIYNRKEDYILLRDALVEFYHLKV